MPQLPQEMQKALGTISQDEFNIHNFHDPIPTPGISTGSSSQETDLEAVSVPKHSLFTYQTETLQEGFSPP